MVPQLGHQRAADDGEEANHADDGQQADAGLDGSVAACELEDQRGVVDGDEQAPKRREELVLQVVELEPPGEVERVELAGGWHERVVQRNKSEGGEEDTGHDPEGDLGATVPGVHGTAKSDGYGEARGEAVVDDDADPVLGSQLLHETDAGLGVDPGQTPREGGRKHGGNEDIDIEGPTPRRAAVGEATADDRADDAAHAVHDGDSGHVEWPLMFVGQNRDVGEAAAVRGSAADARQDPPDDHGVHVGGTAAQGAPHLEQYHAGQEQGLDAEGAVSLASGADMIPSAVAHGL